MMDQVVTFLYFIMLRDSLLDFHPFLYDFFRLIHQILKNIFTLNRRKGGLKTFSFKPLSEFIVEVLLVLVIILVSSWSVNRLMSLILDLKLVARLIFVKRRNWLNWQNYMRCLILNQLMLKFLKRIQIDIWLLLTILLKEIGLCFAILSCIWRKKFAVGRRCYFSFHRLNTLEMFRVICSGFM